MTFSAAMTSAERAPPPNRAISPKVSPGPNDAIRRRFSPVWVGTLHAHSAPGQHEEELGLIAFANDDVALVEQERAHDALEQAAFVDAQSMEHVELGEREFRIRRAVQRFDEQPVLAPFERRIDVTEQAQWPVWLVL